MSPRKLSKPDGPVLLDRIVDSGCRRIGVLGLHAGAGTRTVLRALIRDLHRRGRPFAVTSSPRVPLESEEDPHGAPTRLALPEGAHVLTVGAALDVASATLELVEPTPWSTSAERLGVYRVSGEGEVDLHGPGEAGSMAEALGRLADVTGGTVLVDGVWERRGFAAPGVTEGLVVAFGSGYSATPERSVAAARYALQTLSVSECDDRARSAWTRRASAGAVAALDREGACVETLPANLDDPVRSLRAAGGARLATLVLPHRLTDAFLVPLLRAAWFLTIVVRDATRIRVAPVYHQAWIKGGGRIHVVHPARILAVTTNPRSPHGPDSDPTDFRRAVAGALPDLPVHDAVMESSDRARKTVWRFFS